MPYVRKCPGIISVNIGIIMAMIIRIIDIIAGIITSIFAGITNYFPMWGD